MASVLGGVPAAMAADYAVDAVLVRPGETYRGRAAIERYFASVPDRLGDARVCFDELVVDGETATFSWHLEGGPLAVSGTDTCTIAGGEIVRQVVRLDDADF